MAICTKINTAGTTLQNNLNARGVSCTYGKNSESKQTIKDMADLITSSNLKGSADSLISITANRPYLLEDETTDLTVRLVNGLGQPLANKSVSISDGSSLYSGITNSDGVFVLYGIEVSDNTTFTATYSTVSATCNVYLCEFVDYGVTGNTNSNWVKVSGTDNKTVTSTGTTLANTTSTRYDIFANLGSTSSVYDFTSPFTVELDIVGYVGTTARLQIYDATNNQTYNGAQDTGHWKIIVDGTTVKPYKDGVELTNFTRNIQTARIGFFLTQDTSITYRNFAIY